MLESLLELGNDDSDELLYCMLGQVTVNQERDWDLPQALLIPQCQCAADGAKPSSFSLVLHGLKGGGGVCFARLSGYYACQHRLLGVSGGADGRGAFEYSYSVCTKVHCCRAPVL